MGILNVGMVIDYDISLLIAIGIIVIVIHLANKYLNKEQKKWAPYPKFL